MRYPNPEVRKRIFLISPSITGKTPLRYQGRSNGHPGQYSTTAVVLSYEALVEPVQLFLVIKLQDQLARTPLRRHLNGDARSDMLLKLVNRGLAVGVNSFGLALYLAAGSPSRHPLDLPDGEFPARCFLRQVEP